MVKRIFNRFLFTVFSLLFVLSSTCPLAFSQELKLEILGDVYVHPAAELVTTKTYPDVIRIENNYIEVSLLPNRGRLVFDYIFKPTGNSEIYTNTRPSPVTSPAGYILEFGGYYLSVPWNPRSRQPYDLEYKIVKQTPQEIQVYMWGKDPLKRLFTESWVKVKRNSSLVEVKVKITNQHKKKWKVNLSDYLVTSAGGELTKNSLFLLPISEVVIGKSEGEWMGGKGSVVSWPAFWQRWGKFEKSGSFYAKIDKMRAPFVGISTLDRGDAFLKLWEPFNFFDEVKLWSWGANYQEIESAAPTVNFENRKEFILAPGESVEFEVYLYALKAIDNLSLANKNFAGWVDTDKYIYDAVEDAKINAFLQIGTSGEYSDLTVICSL